MLTKSFILPFLNIALFLFLGIHSVIYAADSSLDSLSYNQLLAEFNKVPSKEERLDFSKYYLERAILDKNYEQIVESYLLYAQCHDGTEIGIKYCEKALELAVKEKSRRLICKSQIELGKQFYYKNNLVDALINYKRADSLNQTLKNQLFEIKIRHGRAVIELEKNELSSAKEFFDLNLAYYKTQKQINKYPKEYILTILGISQYYMRTDSLEKGFKIVNDGIIQSLDLSLSEQYNTLVLFSANYQIIQQNYTAAIDSITKVFSSEQLYFKQNIASAHTSIIYAYLQSGDLDSALLYLKDLENLFEDHNEVIPSLKQSYSLIGDYYKENQDFKEESFYRNLQIELDSILSENNLKMMRNLEKLENNFSIVTDKTSSGYPFFWGLLVLSLVLLIYIYRSIFLKKPILKSEESKPISKPAHSQVKPLELDSATVTKILKGLEKFENDKLFLDVNCSLASTSNILNSNTLYVSKVINNSKQKKFRTYINDLRIDFLVEKIKNNPIYSQYTLKALSDECGFKNVRSFSLAFKDKVGCSPKEYILKKVKNIIN